MLTKNDLNQISDLFDAKIKPLNKDVRSLKIDIRSIKRNQKTMLNLLDTEQMQQRKRIIRLEKRVGISSPQ